MRLPHTFAALSLLTLLVGCDQLGIESSTAVAAKRDAEGKAVGAACRHAGRAIEDCYTLNRKVDKGAMFAGWREMNDYMRENKIEVVAPSLPPPGAPTPKPAPADDEEAADEADASDQKPAKPAAKPAAKAAAKGH